MNEPAFQPGDTCEKYRIVKALAFGGIGEVYTALQENVDRTVALKCLQFRHADRDDLRKRMAMEAKGLGRINHPNVVTVYDAGCTDEGVLWIAMELLKGQTLRKLLRQKRQLSVPDALGYALAIAEGVGAAHQEKIVHRDLKPENVFVTEHDTVKVLDLGTAKFQGWGELKTTDRGRIIGTPAYMSPEHIRCIRVDARSDIYALGIILYEMLAGHPFLHVASLHDYHELARMQLLAEPRPLTTALPGFPEALASFIARMLAKDPNHRPRSMAEVAVQLGLARDSLIGGSPLPASVGHGTSNLAPMGVATNGNRSGRQSTEVDEHGGTPRAVNVGGGAPSLAPALPAARAASSPAPPLVAQRTAPLRVSSPGLDLDQKDTTPLDPVECAQSIPAQPPVSTGSPLPLSQGEATPLRMATNGGGAPSAAPDLPPTPSAMAVTPNPPSTLPGGGATGDGNVLSSAAPVRSHMPLVKAAASGFAVGTAILVGALVWRFVGRAQLDGAPTHETAASEISASPSAVTPPVAPALPVGVATNGNRSGRQSTEVDEHGGTPGAVNVGGGAPSLAPALPVGGARFVEAPASSASSTAEAPPPKPRNTARSRNTASKPKPPRPDLPASGL